MGVVLLILLAVGVSLAVADVVLEAARNEVAQIQLLGYTLYEPPTQERGILILCGIVAIAALIVVTALAFARGRRLNHKMAALDERLDQRSMHEASEAANANLLQHRVIELQTSVDELTERRDEAYEEMRTARAKTEALRELIAQQRAALAHSDVMVDLAAVEPTEGEEDEEGEEAPEVVIPEAPEIPEELLSDEPVESEPGPISIAQPPARNKRGVLGTWNR
jgi:FtsZ-interacting cell division protein ZipA